jgi:choline dehydrogenase-like flavoprotein
MTKKVVIVGGGTAGLVIANQLQDFFNVIVIEKSKYKRYPFWYKIPLFIGLLFKSKKTKYISKREHNLPNGRNIPFFDSNLLGGASVMNGCVHVLGNKIQWSAILKKFNSNYNDLLKSYGDLYSLREKDKYKISLSAACQNDIDKAFTESLNEQGVSCGDMNYSDRESCGPIFNTIKKYFRTSVLTLIEKKNFQQLLNENVESLLFNNDKEVVGVRTSLRDIHSDYVILSGGVIGTCSLLLKEKSRLKQSDNFLTNIDIGIDVQDHTNLRINVLTNKNIDSLNEISSSFLKKLNLVFKHFSGQLTLMRGTGATTAAHLDLDKNGVIDTRIQIVQFSETGRAGSDGKLFSSSKPGFSISITAINPKSKGKIDLDGDNITVDPMYLSSEDDVDLLKMALAYCMDLLKSEPLRQYVFKIEGEKEIVSNPEKYIGDNMFSGYHLIGGSHDAINSDFSVKNTKGLYVCDASIFNQYAASNIHSSVVLIADIFAKKFLSSNKF